VTQSATETQAQVPATTVSEPAVPALPRLELDSNQKVAISNLVTVADALSQGLAADDLQAFKQAVPKLAPVLESIRAAFQEPHPWAGLIQELANSSKLEPAGDLNEARAAFLPFSTAMTELAKGVRQQAPEAAMFKIYRCPMAPKPGLWIQQQGPLRNPFYGSEMLECGVEVK
jgi:Cu(I)/Ag(I) efflux system membrane fusion protein